MANEESKPFAPPVYHSDEAIKDKDVEKTPFTRQSNHDRGKRAQAGTGPVVGSGTGAGGAGGGNEVYDDDDAGGGGAPPTGGSPVKSPGKSSDHDVAAGEEAKVPPGSISL